MRVFVDAVAVLAPGLPDWPAARAVMRGERAWENTPLAPLQPAHLAAAERRRSSPTVRLALCAAEQALAQCRVPPQDMATVFSSHEAAGIITHQLCEALAGDRVVSPTQFHNSVHNAPSGYYSIAMNARRAANSICRGSWSFAAGLLAAGVQVASDGVPVLFVCYDSPLPPPLSDSMPVLDATAIALVLTPAAGPDSLGEWELAIDDANAEAAWPAWIPPSWHANASARGFAALTTLADADRPVGRLPLSPELSLRVMRC